MCMFVSGSGKPQYKVSLRIQPENPLPARRQEEETEDGEEENPFPNLEQVRATGIFYR